MDQGTRPSTIEQVLSVDPASLDQKADRLLLRLLDEDAKIFGEQKIGGPYLSLLSINPSAAADSILRRILETNHHVGIQDEVRWAWPSVRWNQPG